MKWIKSFEGRLNKTASKVHKSDQDIDSVRTKVEGILKSKELDYKQVGNDLEFEYGDDQVNIMFREDYIGIKTSESKFVDEFKYTEFGKFKSKLSEVISKLKAKF